MSPSGPLQIIALRPIAVGSVAWRLGAVQRVSVFLKATFGLVNDQPARLVAPQEIVIEDRRMQGLSSLDASAENAPYLPSAGVVLTGHAYAPGGTPTSAMSVRLAVYRDQAIIDKTLHIFGDRTAQTAATPQPFVKMPLVWEKAFGGTGVEDNPVGLGAVFGIRALPNLVDPNDQRKPACFGPIPRQWVARRRLLGNADPRLLDRVRPELPEDFDWRYYHAAPVDQQVDFLQGDEWIVLDGLHPTLPRLQSRLPQVTAKALWRMRNEIGEIEEQPLDLVADLLIIDADRQVCSLVWRGNFFLDAEESLAHMQIYAGVEMPNYPLVWPETEGANAAARASFIEPELEPELEAIVEPEPNVELEPEPIVEPAPSLEAPPVTRSIPPSDDDEHTRVAGFVLPTAKGVLPFQSADGAAIGEEGSTLDQPAATRANDGRFAAVTGPAAPAARETDRLIASKVGRSVLPFTAHAAAPSAASPSARLPEAIAAAAPPAPRFPLPAAKHPLGQTGDEHFSPFTSALPFKTPPPAAPQIPSMVPEDEEHDGDPNIRTSAIRLEDHLRMARLPATPFGVSKPAPAEKPAFPGALFASAPAEPEDGTREYQRPASSAAEGPPADLPFSTVRPRDLPFAASAPAPATGLPFATPQGQPAPLLQAPPPPVTHTGQPIDDTLEHPVPAELARRIDLALADPSPPPSHFRSAASPAPPPMLTLTPPPMIAPPPLLTAPSIVGAQTIDPPPAFTAPPEPPSFAPPAAALGSIITEVSAPIAPIAPVAPIPDSSTSVEAPGEALRMPAIEADDGLRAQVREKLRAGEPLRDLALAGADLRGLDFTGAMLGSVNFKGARLDRCVFANARLADAQLSAADLTGADLRAADLSRADLSRSTLEGARFDRAILTDANLSAAKGTSAVFDSATGPRANFARGAWEKASFRAFEAANADFTGASLSGACFESASLIELRLDDAKGQGATFDGARMPQASARGAELTRSSFKDADSPGSNWEKATLDDSGFQGANLKGASLVRATCQKTSFSGADLAGANLQNLAGDGADFTSATLEGADLRQARLRETRFDDANLRKVMATKADLGRCRFVRADLAQATLRTAKLKGANFTLAKLEGADLRDADLEQATLSGASKQTAKLNGANLKDVVDGAPNES